jgi:hypothetical protein
MWLGGDPATCGPLGSYPYGISGSGHFFQGRNLSALGAHSNNPLFGRGHTLYQHSSGTPPTFFYAADKLSPEYKNYSIFGPQSNAVFGFNNSVFGTTYANFVTGDNSKMWAGNYNFIAGGGHELGDASGGTGSAAFRSASYSAQFGKDNEIKANAQYIFQAGRDNEIWDTVDGFGKYGYYEDIIQLGF